MQTAVSKLISSPVRNLIVILAFVAAVTTASTIGYVAAGWSFPDAIYMVVLTVFSVGYGEVRPIDTWGLHVLTMSTMVFGCTGMILLTGALVQVFTSEQIQRLMGGSGMNSEIEKLNGHVIVCGFGRIGVMLAEALKDGGQPALILERDEARAAEARSLGHLCLQADAADEAGLKAAGVERARVLATVLPDDAANVFITLSARSLNRDLQIIARGDQPSTESKLIYAGANRVVLPIHIGAERIAELILHPETARFIRGSERMLEFDKTLRTLGLRLETLTIPDGAGAVGQTVREMEQRARGGAFVVQIDRRGGEVITRPEPQVRFEANDGVLLMARAEAAALSALFHAAKERVRVGRSLF